MILESQPLLAAMLGGWELVILIWIALIAFWIWMIVDCARCEQEAKALWLVLIILLVVGAPVYFFARRLPRRARQKAVASTQQPPERTDGHTAPQPPSSSEPRVSKLAVASVSLSVLSIIIGPFGALPGVVLGHLASSKMQRDQSLRGAGFATAGLVIGYIVLTIYTLIILNVIFGKK